MAFTVAPQINAIVLDANGLKPPSTKAINKEKSII